VSGEAQRRRLRALVRRAGVKASESGDLSIVELAFAHKSYASEKRVASNERIEFLGDSVLGFVTAGWLYATYPDAPEGELNFRKARIVNDGQLAVSARRLGFPQLMQLGAGTRDAGGAESTSILADAFEAFVAALYLTYGLEAASRFVLDQHVAVLDHTVELRDPKSRLQDLAQASLGGTPAYRDRQTGTKQAPAFTSTVEVNGRVLGTGSGSSKKAAQQAAAEAALAHQTTDAR
jgi:ribonuclease-3